jgi:hypothetical protein
MAIVARILNLPRELRDSIYIRLFDVTEDYDPNRDLLYWWECFEEPWLPTSEDLCVSPWRPKNMTGLRPPHFVDQAFVGRQFAREVLLRFKDFIGKDLRLDGNKSPVAEFALIDESIKDFVETDAFGVGITMQELVQNLDLRINFQCDSVDTDELGETPSNVVEGLHYKVDPTILAPNSGRGSHAEQHLANLERGVEALSCMTHSNRLIIRDDHSKHIVSRPRIITLVIRQECRSQEALFAILKLVMRAYHSQREKGCTLKVQYHSEEIGMKILFEDDVWTWTEKDWSTKLKDKNTSNVVDVSTDHSAQQALVWRQFKNTLFAKDHRRL